MWHEFCPPQSSDGRQAFTPFCREVMPYHEWDYPHLVYCRRQLARLTVGEIDRLAFALPPQHGKPVSEDSRVTLPDNRCVRIADIRPGDPVITHRNRPRRVLAVHDQGELPTLTLTARPINLTPSHQSVRFPDTTTVGKPVVGNPYTTTAAPSHPFLTHRGWLPLSQIRPGDLLARLPRARNPDTTKPVVAHTPPPYGFENERGGAVPTSHATDISYRIPTSVATDILSVTYTSAAAGIPDAIADSTSVCSAYEWCVVESVWVSASARCMCLTVEGDATFISDGFIVHNTASVVAPYLAWRMIRTPGLRVGVGSHTQTYANKIGRRVQRIVLDAGAELGKLRRAEEWHLSNGSTFIAKGVGGAIAGESIDLMAVDDVFGSRETADSPTEQEKVYEWYMDDVQPRLQNNASILFVNTRWSPGDLIGRLQQSDEWKNWDYHVLRAIAEDDDPLGREPGQPLCPELHPLKQLLSFRQSQGLGFESLYQGHPVPRGGTMFRREWFKIVSSAPHCRMIRWWDLASSRADDACFTSGVLIGHQPGTDNYFIIDVIRGRWSPAERNEVMLQTAIADSAQRGFVRTYFESPPYDRDGAAARAIIAKLAGHSVRPDPVVGNKQLRAEPLAGAAKAGLIHIVNGPFTLAFLSEMEQFPRGQYLDQVDSCTGGYNRLSRGATGAEGLFIGIV